MTDTPEIINGVFTRDQAYIFPVNESENGGSITVIQMTIPKGTEVQAGYAEVRASLRTLGLCPAVVCPAMGFPEIVDS